MRSSSKNRPHSTWLWLALVVVTLWGASRLALLSGIMGDGETPTRAKDPATAASTQRVGPCRVRRVIDGDTIDVECPGLRERVRLLRVDTPEREQPGYSAAKAALLGLIDGGNVYLDYEHSGELARGNHGRVLAYLFVGERNLNIELVRMGWTAFFDDFGPGRFAAEFEAAEREARRGRRGLWGMRR